MSRSRTFLGSAAIYAGTNVLVAGLPLLLLPILTRTLSVDDYGKVAMFTVLISIFGAFTGLNVHGAVGVRYFERDKYDFPSYVVSSLAILLTSTFAVTLVTSLLAGWLADITSIPPEWIIIAALVSGASFIIQTQLAYWQSARRPWSFVSLRLTQSVADAGMTLLLLLGLGWSWQARTTAIAFALTLAAAIALLLMWRTHLLRGRIERAYVRDALAFGIPLIPNVLGALLVGYIDRLIVADRLDIGAAGLYSLGWQLGMVIGLLADAFVRAVVPWLYSNLGKGTEDALGKVVGLIYVCFALFPLLGIAALAAIYLLKGLILPGAFEDALPILPWFFAGNVFRGMYYAVIGVAFYTSRTYIPSLISMVTGLLGIGGTLLRVDDYGLHGAAAAFAASNALTFFMAWWMCARLAPLPWANPLRSLLLLRNGND